MGMSGMARLGSSENWHNGALALAAGDVNFARGVDQDIYLTADSESGEVDSRLYRETGSGQDQTILASFEAVHVGAIAVNFLADVVAGAMNVLGAVAGL